MLEGKPTRQDDTVTMRAIKDILSDYEGDLTGSAPTSSQGPAQDSAQNPAPMRGHADRSSLTLTPVKAVDAKVRPAAFTTVPSVDAPDAGVEILRTDAPAQTATPQPRNAAPNAAPQAPGAKMSDPRMSAPKTAARNRPAFPRIRLPRISLPKRALPRLTAPAPLRKLSPRWGAIAVLFALAMLYPALVVLPVFATLVLVIGAFAVFGAERVWDRVGRALSRYEARAPRKAARLMVRLDAFAVRWDAVLDRFPEGWVDGLYLPDFANRHERSRQEDAQLTARLQRMHSQV